MHLRCRGVFRLLERGAIGVGRLGRVFVGALGLAQCDIGQGIIGVVLHAAFSELEGLVQLVVAERLADAPQHELDRFGHLLRAEGAVAVGLRRRLAVSFCSSKRAIKAS